MVEPGFQSSYILCKCIVPSGYWCNFTVILNDCKVSSVPEMCFVLVTRYIFAYITLIYNQMSMYLYTIVCGKTIILMRNVHGILNVVHASREIK